MKSSQAKYGFLTRLYFGASDLIGNLEIWEVTDDRFTFKIEESVVKRV